MKEDIEQTRHCTAIHESGHAVISYLLRRHMKHAVLFTHKWGEVMPKNPIGDTRVEYYTHNNPANDADSKRIQDDLRRDVAIAMAGKIAQGALCGNWTLDERDFEKDRSYTNELTTRIHRWIEPRCWRQWGAATCPFCKAYRDSTTHMLSHVLAEGRVENSIKAFAEKLKTLGYCRPIGGPRIEEFLKGEGLSEGSMIDLIPAASDAGRGFDEQLPSPLFEVRETSTFTPETPTGEPCKGKDGRTI